MNAKLKFTAKAITGVIFGSALAFSTYAADPAYDNAKDRADANYDVQKESCDRLTGNEKDVCMKQAKANKKTAEANAKMQHDVREDSKDAQETKMDAQYKVAKEKCDTLSGDAKDACVNRAKATYNQ